MQKLKASTDIVVHGIRLLAGILDISKVLMKSQRLKYCKKLLTAL